jgi:hypothetical protein
MIGRYARRLLFRVSVQKTLALKTSINYVFE